MDQQRESQISGYEQENEKKLKELLSRVEDLHEKGVLNDSAYEAKKQELAARLQLASQSQTAEKEEVQSQPDEAQVISPEPQKKERPILKHQEGPKEKGKSGPMRIVRILGIAVACIGIVFSIIMIINSQNIIIPSKLVSVNSSFWGYEGEWSANTGIQYLGGDAYNYIVEASLKAGYYNATVIRKTVMETGGIILLAISTFFLFYSVYSLQSCLAATKKAQYAAETSKDYQSFVLQHLQRIEENTIPERNDSGNVDSEE